MSDIDLHAAQETLKELEARRATVGSEARLMLANGMRKVIELYAAHQTKREAQLFQACFEDMAEELLDYVESEALDLFDAEEKDLLAEIEKLETKIRAEEQAHEQAYTQPY